MPPAWAGLAEANVKLYSAGMVSPAEVVPLARSAAERAIALDSAIAEPRFARAVIWLLYDREPAKAGEELQRAIALDPNLADGFHWQSHRFLAMGETDSSLAMSRRAIEASPLDPSLRAHLGWHYLLARQDSLAAGAFAEALALAPGAAAWDEHFAWRPVAPADTGVAYDSLAPAAKARYVSPYAAAVAAAAAGRIAPAVAALSRAVDEHDPAVIFAGLDPPARYAQGLPAIRDVARPSPPDYNPHPTEVSRPLIRRL